MRMQEILCDNRFCAPDAVVALGGMDSEEIKRRFEALDITQSEFAEMIGLTQDKVSKALSGKRQWKAAEVALIASAFAKAEANGGVVRPDLPAVDGGRDYLPVEVLPSYAGMGGGGTGEGDHEQALVPRALVEDELRAKPEDLLLIEARGDSMMPDFMHGDQILIDKRDKNPVQPGSFALWDGDGYVVKLVERVPRERGRYRIFSANERFSAYEVEEAEITIMGRPVWFGRRL